MWSSIPVCHSTGGLLLELTGAAEEIFSAAPSFYAKPEESRTHLVILKAMLRYLRSHLFVTVLATAVVLYVTHLIWSAATYDPLEGLTTALVERGDVEEIVSVSGVMRARSTAELAFPSPGVVSKVYVKEGDAVKEGDVLASVGAETLVAERASTLAELRLAEADRDELVAGVREEAQAVTDTTVAIAEAELARVKETQDLSVANAKRTLLSSGLTARSEKVNEDAAAPVVSGTYRCEAAGDYKLSVFSSRSSSGYSLNASGLESGTFTVSTEQPAVLGSCGLYLLFDADSNYSGSIWTIHIPNESGASYITNQNAYEAALAARANAIAAATEALSLAKSKQALENADPRQEALARAEAKVAQANARVARIDAELGDRAVVAPFDGTVTLVDILPGETAGAAPVFTVLAADAFELVARIPEIDITKVEVGQNARVVFDARSDAELAANVSYVSPLPTQIDGVAYFEVKLTLTEPPTWLRGGLNADIDIIIAKQSGVLRVPKRYIVREGEADTVLTLQGNLIEPTPITVTFVGNDGYVAIEGLSADTTLIAP